MPPVAVLTDSSACVPTAWAADPALVVLPLGVLLPGRRLADGGEAAPAVAAALAAGEPVRAVAPSPVDYLRALDQAPDGSVVVTPAADVAVMHRNAVLASRLAAGDVQVVDTGTAGPAHGLCVVAGLIASRAGLGARQVAEAVRRAADGARLVATVPDLARVGAAVGAERPRPARRPGGHRGGSPSGGAPGAEVAARPAVFRFHEGVPVPVAVASDADPIDALVAAWRDGNGATATSMVVFHADDPTGAEQLRTRLGRRPSPLARGADVNGGDVDGAGVHGEAIDMVAISPAMAVHTGAGCVGVAWLDPTT